LLISAAVSLYSVAMAIFMLSLGYSVFRNS